MLQWKIAEFVFIVTNLPLKLTQQNAAVITISCVAPINTDILLKIKRVIYMVRDILCLY